MKDEKGSPQKGSDHMKKGLTMEDKDLSDSHSEVPPKSKDDDSDEIPAEIIFYQYVQGSGNISNKDPNNYIFYDSQKQGFNSIADMFK